MRSIRSPLTLDLDRDTGHTYHPRIGSVGLFGNGCSCGSEGCRDTLGGCDDRPVFCKKVSYLLCGGILCLVEIP